jgi:hypothetical protein
MSFSRRLRSSVVIATLWAIAWLPSGIALGLLLGWLSGPQARADVIPFVGFWAAVGFLSGAAFAVLLAALERGRRIEELSDLRVACWGVLGGATFPVFATSLVLALTKWHLGEVAVPLFLAMGALGGACGLATLWTARRATRKSTIAGSPA